jgi:hypothetical protein
MNQIQIQQTANDHSLDNRRGGLSSAEVLFNCEMNVVTKNTTAKFHRVPKKPFSFPESSVEQVD